MKGILTGIILSVYVGATFFTVMETSIRRGPAAAMILNAGVWISDISIILLAYAGTSGLINIIEEKSWMGIGGGLVFLAIGAAYFFRKPKETVRPLSGSRKGIAILFLKGFAINSLNPGVYIFWFGAMVVAGTSLNLSSDGIFIYFLSVVSTVVGIDIIKVLSSGYLRRFINDSLMKKLFRITGAVLAIFGIIIIARSFPGSPLGHIEIPLFFG